MTGPAEPGSAPTLRYDAWFESAWGRYAWRIETGTVLAALGPLDGRRVADIGCGTGRLVDILTSHGARAVGIDTDPGMLTLAATRGLIARTDSPARTRAWTPPSPWPPRSSPLTRPRS
jgi:SAM-dependent methyltransferase